jgi:hypothetical protein
MDLATAKAFLVQHQPMPPIDEAPEELMDQYVEVINYLLDLDPPDPELIPLILGSFGIDYDLGVHEAAFSFLLQFSWDQLLPYLPQALCSSYTGRRLRAVLLAEEVLREVVPQPREIVDILLQMKFDDSYNVRSSVVSALSLINDPRADDALEMVLQSAMKKVEDIQQVIIRRS